MRSPTPSTIAQVQPHPHADYRPGVAAGGELGAKYIACRVPLKIDQIIGMWISLISVLCIQEAVSVNTEESVRLESLLFSWPLAG